MTAFITCSGISNTGKLTTHVAIALMRNDPISFEWARAQEEPARIREVMNGEDLVVVLDGCTDCCAKKKLQSLGITPVMAVTATELGVVKNGMADPTYTEINLVMQGVRQALARYRRD